MFGERPAVSRFQIRFPDVAGHKLELATGPSEHVRMSQAGLESYSRTLVARKLLEGVRLLVYQLRMKRLERAVLDRCTERFVCSWTAANLMIFRGDKTHDDHTIS